MSATSIGQATVLRMIFKANPRLHQEFINSTTKLLFTHGVVLDEATVAELTLAVAGEFVVGKAHVIFSQDIDHALER
ncbi:MAG: hypothetical protein ACR65O_14230 [Methylomicrobium sp.]